MAIPIINDTSEQLGRPQSHEELINALAAYIDRILEDFEIPSPVFIDQSGNAKQAVFFAAKGVEIIDANLCELETLSLAGAQALTKYPTDLLELDGLSHLSPEVAACLASRRGGLSLQGLEKIDEVTAKALATHKEFESDDCSYGLYLNLTQASSRVIKALRKKVGTINDGSPDDYCAQLSSS